MLQCLTILKVRKFFTLCLNGIFCIQFEPAASLPVTVRQWEKSVSLFFAPSHQVFNVRMKCYSVFYCSGEARILCLN